MGSKGRQNGPPRARAARTRARPGARRARSRGCTLPMLPMLHIRRNAWVSGGRLPSHAPSQHRCAFPRARAPLQLSNLEIK